MRLFDDYRKEHMPFNFYLYVKEYIHYIFVIFGINMEILERI